MPDVDARKSAGTPDPASVPDPTSVPDPADDRALLEDAVRAAGALALSFFGGASRSWKKADNSPVGEADLAVDALLKERLAGARPGYGWLSEESAPEPGGHAGDPRWIVDPIDGTTAFLAGRPEWTISVALARAGWPVLGAVFNPVTRQYFDAMAGAGARLNGAAIAVTRQDTIEGASLAAFASGLGGRRWRVAWPPVHVRPVNSMAYRLCLVAAGRYDATLSASPKSDWDLAAADLILAEAGGLATTFTGRPFVYDAPSARQPNVVAAGPALHGAMLDHIARSWQG